MWECVYREGEKARSTVQVDAGTQKDLQEGDAEAGKTVGQEAQVSRGESRDLDEERKHEGQNRE